MNPGYLLALHGQIRAGAFVLALAPFSYFATVALALNPWTRK